MGRPPCAYGFVCLGNNDNDIRVVTIEGDPWFVAADAFNTLEYPNGSRTYQLKQLSDDETKVLKIQTNKRGAPSKLISESGLYKLIMRSDKPQAKPFQDWVTQVVLPSIRKDGGYIAGNVKGLSHLWKALGLGFLLGWIDLVVTCLPATEQ